MYTAHAPHVVQRWWGTVKLPLSEWVWARNNPSLSGVDGPLPWEQQLHQIQRSCLKSQPSPHGDVLILFVLLDGGLTVYL